MPHLLLTGATGFVGSALARSFSALGWNVHALVRASSPRMDLAAGGVRFYEYELTDAVLVQRAVAAVRAQIGEAPLVLVHNAALISYRTRDRDLLWRTNVEGTRHLLAAARDHGVQRFLHMSSIVTIASAKPGEVSSEASPFNLAACAVAYVDSKRAAEELVLAAGPELDVVVVNPSAIFGPVGRASNTARFLRALEQGRLGPLAPPGSMGVVGVADVVAGVQLALASGRSGERYLLCESYYSHLALFRLAATLLGVRGPRAACPARLWPAVIRCARWLDRWQPLELSPPEALVMLGQDLRASSSKARAELGWRPRPFAGVLAETIEHLQCSGWLRSPRR